MFSIDYWKIAHDFAEQLNFLQFTISVLPTYMVPQNLFSSYKSINSSVSYIGILFLQKSYQNFQIKNKKVLNCWKAKFQLLKTMNQLSKNEPGSKLDSDYRDYSR